MKSPRAVAWSAVVLIITAGLMAGGDRISGVLGLATSATDSPIDRGWTNGATSGTCTPGTVRVTDPHSGSSRAAFPPLDTATGTSQALVDGASTTARGSATAPQPTTPLRPDSGDPRLHPHPSIDELRASIASVEQPPRPGEPPEPVVKPPRKLALNDWNEVRFQDPEQAYAFDFDPSLAPAGKIRFAIPVDGPQCVLEVVNVPQQAQVRLDGQLIEPGKRYLIMPGAVLQGSTPMGVHLRPIRPGEILDQPNGPG